MVWCLGCTQPITEGQETEKDLLGRVWHLSCFNDSADDFMLASLRVRQRKQPEKRK